MDTRRARSAKSIVANWLCPARTATQSASFTASSKTGGLLQAECGLGDIVGDQRVIDHHFPGRRLQGLHDRQHWRVPQVVGVVLEREAQHRHLRRAEILAQRGQAVPDQLVGVRRHRIVDLARRLRQAKPQAMLPARAPQNPRILGEAGAADSDARQEHVDVAAALGQGVRARDNVEHVHVQRPA